MFDVLQYAHDGLGASGIAEAVEDAVNDGRLSPGAALPSIRELAEQLDVSPTTVAAAYRRLRRRGVVVTRDRSGTAVAPRPPLPERPAPTVPENTLDLASGNPDPELLPRLDDVLPTLDVPPRLYGEEATRSDLREVASERLRGNGIDPSHLSVVSGALDGVERVLRARLRTGDRVAVEDPGFTGVIDLCRAMGLELAPVEVDDEGPVPTSLERALDDGVDAVIVTPRAQNPTGAALSPDRVDELARLLDGSPQVLVIEDDHAAEISGAPVLTLTRGRDRWAVIRSVSKALGPDLRTALLVGDRTTMRRVEGMQQLGAGWVSHILQALVAALWRSPEIDRLLREAADTYTARRRTLIGELKRHGVAAHGRSGLNVWVPVTDEGAVVQRLLQRGWSVRAGDAYRLRSPAAVRVTTATLPGDEAPRLGRAIAEILSPSTRTRSR